MTRAIQQISKTDPGDRNLLQRVKRGDRTVVSEIIDRYGSRVWTFALTQESDTVRAEELAHQVFRDIWRFCRRTDRGGDQHQDDLVVNQIIKFRLIENKKRDSPTRRETSF